MAFFSGGVDSFFTAVRHRRGAPGSELELNDLLFIEGADIPVTNRDALSRVYASLSDAAAQLGRRLVAVAANLRNTRLAVHTDWATSPHGAAMAATALAREKQYRLVMIASSMTYRLMPPWGSHPIAAAYDALDSCATLRAVEFCFDRLARAFLPGRLMNGVRELESIARALHKPEPARALRRSRRHSRFLHRAHRSYVG